MFLFFSKLLPLFLYPLGLSCVLLIGALLWLWRGRSRWAAGCISLSLLLLLLGGNKDVSNHLVKSLEWQHLPPTEMPTAEAIVVLGGAIKPASSPRPWVDVSEAGDRLLHGVRLYQAGKAPLLIFSGGRIDWQDGGPPESDDMAQMAMAMGVPATAIVQDPTSLNTYQNAVNVKKILEEQGLNQVLLVTSAMHMPRSLKIFQRQGIDTIPAPTDFMVTVDTLQETRSTLEGRVLGLIPDAESLHYLTKALKEYIGTQVYRLRGWL